MQRLVRKTPGIPGRVYKKVIRGCMNRTIGSVLFLFASLMLTGPLRAQEQRQQTNLTDSDHDGLSDASESALLARFLPQFFISRSDCSVRPAQFIPQRIHPTVLNDDGTIYGQAFPRKGHAGQVELHYYHLWRRDCGEMGHRLDAEHVSVLLTLGPTISDAKALYWYSAAHEDTLCDASQMAAAETLDAEKHGAKVWISEGKHASFLAEILCSHGCGGDRCQTMEPLTTRQIINLGELNMPMNEIGWLRSSDWPLSTKLQRSDFTEARVSRIQRSSATELLWANPAKRPAQAAILGANTGIGGAALGARSTDTALLIAHADTSSAVNQGAVETGRALKSSSHNVWNALKKAANKAARALDVSPR